MTLTTHRLTSPSTPLQELVLVLIICDYPPIKLHLTFVLDVKPCKVVFVCPHHL